jgi:hypothetical protein
MRVIRSATVLLIAIAWGSCTSSTAPPPSITLFVQNGTCTPSGCDTVYVLAFPNKQPATPGGLWRLDLGIVPAQSGCFDIPSTASAGASVTWTTGDSLSLALITTPPTLATVPTTGAFRPASATGWSIVYPTDANATPTATCRH